MKLNDFGNEMQLIKLLAQGVQRIQRGVVALQGIDLWGDSWTP